MQSLTGPYRPSITILDHARQYRTIHDCSNPYRIIPDHKGLFKTLHDLTRQYRTMQDHTNPNKVSFPYPLHPTLHDFSLQ